MLYRDYSRDAGEWVPNIHGGRENLEAVSFLQHLNAVVAERCPGAIMVAEESTAWPGVTRPTSEQGLGFTYKWNMGWMHDALQYMARGPVHRQWHHDNITFGLLYAFSERFVLPLSHDELVHGKGSLLGKMPGDRWQRFANLRAALGLMWTHPGKKMLFMGGELAQPREWNHDGSLDWDLLDDADHAGIQRLVRDLNAFYRREPAMHRRDSDGRGFRWLIGDDRANSVFAFLRSGEDGDKPVLVVCNMTPAPRHDYVVGVPRAAHWREIINTDSRFYGGNNMGNAGDVTADDVPAHGETRSLRLILPPLSMVATARGLSVPAHIDRLLLGSPHPRGATWTGSASILRCSRRTPRASTCIFGSLRPTRDQAPGAARVHRRSVARLPAGRACRPGLWLSRLRAL